MQIERQIARFCDRFGPVVLRELDGEDLLQLLHGRDNSDSRCLAYWLEFKNDDEFAGNQFGGIGGGSALKFGIFQRKSDSAWMTGSPQAQQVLTVEDAIEIALKQRDELANPRHRRAPAPRPDYALFYDKALHVFLDAKYRDIWDLSLPAKWLYQLSIYALASPSEVSVLLYASMSAEAREERVEVQPIMWSGKRPASVILRPVPLAYLAKLLDPDRDGSLARKRQKFANQLVALETHKYDMLVA